MATSTSLAAERLSLAPLGAGDLIDRTIRLYRRHFLTLIRAAAPPVVAAAVGSVLFTVCWRAVPLTASGARLVLYVAGTIVGWVLSASGPFLLLIILGGASRNLVAHLLWGEPVGARAIYAAVRARFWGLFGATLVVAVSAAITGFVTLMIYLVVFSLTVAVLVATVASSGSPLASLVIGVIVLALALAACVAFFWVMGHLAYVPQVMMIEGRGVFDAVSRSIALARGNVRRLMAMFMFTFFATYSALMLFLIPLGFYGYTHGIDVNPFSAQSEWPLWYGVGYQVVYQLSVMLLTPVWMLGLSLLYVDERVRHEGYDIELMAAARLGEMPQLPDGRIAPLAPALVNARAAAAPKR